jgi:hypothetical protein
MGEYRSSERALQKAFTFQIVQVFSDSNDTNGKAIR